MYTCSVCVCVCVSSGSRLLQPAHVCDILKALILLLSFSMTHYLDYAMMYHLIRGQSVIKLYIIYNMLEVTQLFCKAQHTKQGARDSLSCQTISGSPDEGIIN